MTAQSLGADALLAHLGEDDFSADRVRAQIVNLLGADSAKLSASFAAAHESVVDPERTSERHVDD
jgi:hypothetical protein